jgi:hypothetical protein
MSNSLREDFGPERCASPGVAAAQIFRISFAWDESPTLTMAGLRAGQPAPRVGAA